MNQNEREWLQPLQELFQCLAQDPMEDAPSLMDISGSAHEQNRWFRLLDGAIRAADDNDAAVLSIFDRTSGIGASTPEQARSILIELRDLYAAEAEP